MDETVYETLVGVTNSDFNIRTAAESRLKELASAPEFPVSLARLTMNKDLLVPHRQLAALTLKSYIDTHWSSKHDKFVGPELSEQSKSIVREVIVTGLADPESKIRVVSAYVVSKIATDDFPEDWPNLLDILFSYLKSNNADSVHGAMRVLLEMVKKDISIQQLPQIGPVLVPELFTILTSDNVYSFRTRGRAVTIFSSCIEMLSALREENPTLADQMVGPIIPQWLQAFGTILNHHVQDNAEKATEEYGLKIDVIKSICTISGQFPKYISDYLPQLFEPIWNDLHNLRERYVQEFVTDSSDVNETFQDSDGNEIGFQNLIYVLFDFVSAACSKKSVRNLFVTPDNQPTDFFIQMLYVLIVYMQITQEQMEVWSTNANQFVADEEEGTYTFNTRVAAIDVLFTFLDAFPIPFFNALSKVVQRHVAESLEMRNNGISSWWKIHEACLLATGRMNEDLMEYLEDESQKVQFDLRSLFDNVVLEDMKLSDLPFLQGRAFVFASEYAKILPQDFATQYVTIAVQALQSTTSGVPVKISALRALNNFCKHLDAQYVTPYQVPIMESACQLLPVATDESLILLLDTLGSSVKINREITARYEQTLTQAILDAWNKFSTDSIINSYILDIFEEFSKNEHYFPSLCNRALPFIAQVLTEANVEPTIKANAIDLLTAMIAFGPSPLPDQFTEQMYPVLMQLAWQTPDSEILQSTQECLKQFVVHDTEHLVRWHDASGKSGLDYAIHFVDKLLDPSATESDAAFVGELIVTLIKKVGNNIAPVLPRLLSAVLTRLESTHDISQVFVQSLVLVFAHLIISQQDTTLQFLVQTFINSKSGLTILMTHWVDNYESFSGYYSLKVSAIALSKIFLVNNPDILNMSVKGDIVVNPNAGIVTRSKSKRNPDQYTAIPLSMKIIKLLVADLGNSLPNDTNAQDEADSIGDEDGDWEDVVDDVATRSRQEYQLLSDVLANITEDDDDEENNPDLKNDPIYQTDLRTYLVDFFRNCSGHNVNHFMEICQQLTEDEQFILHSSMN
ncbi:ARM repeat-containing protein [Hesseltinella vesiculosa]|uniref:ARM repeat-containing protein n=1 Tax=Hesseltinella vesiculosa TaxID=101127 RepID=A0A1X2GI50_9FUNG|nr:ARM repeat-containing protein [Hesseltinella vesiculosa]